MPEPEQEQTITPEQLAALPEYKCHKVVRATKIRAVHASSPTAVDMLEVDHFPELVHLPDDWVSRHRPEPGGYLVVYADGYMSYSPAKAFEEGYTALSRLTAEQLQQDPILQYFAWSHLPPHLQAVSRPFAELAGAVIMPQPRSPERTVALRKLLECKDATVRAALPPVQA